MSESEELCYASAPPYLHGATVSYWQVQWGIATRAMISGAA